jgi:hypothetical protein
MELLLYVFELDQDLSSIEFAISLRLRHFTNNFDGIEAGDLRVPNHLGQIIQLVRVDHGGICLARINRQHVLLQLPNQVDQDLFLLESNKLLVDLGAILARD